MSFNVPGTQHAYPAVYPVLMYHRTDWYSLVYIPWCTRHLAYTTVHPVFRWDVTAWHISQSISSSCTMGQVGTAWYHD